MNSGPRESLSAGGIGPHKFRLAVNRGGRRSDDGSTEQRWLELAEQVEALAA